MPARRSRTERWRESLNNLVDRNGPIEITVPGNGESPDLIWRVRLLEVTDEYLVVEQPTTLHHQIPVHDASDLIGGIAIGQNRWMFRTRVIDHLDFRAMFGTVAALRLAMPHTVERCQRRNFYRTSTATLSLPPVKIWKLKDPDSAIPLEVATKAAILDSQGSGPANDPFELIKPDLGSSLVASMLNIGGGGVGMLVSSADTGILNQHGPFWLRLELQPSVPIPLSLTARLAHTRVDSSGDVHAGFAFDFVRNREYEPFIAEQICRYVADLQKPKSGDKRAA
ncbi:MAG: hypothetical protein H6808_05760 [Phycisphaera sp.]|nr:hypothetical protein [Phycisphaera sp.]